jgi:RHS repeat-associated protein
MTASPSTVLAVCDKGLSNGNVSYNSLSSSLNQHNAVGGVSLDQAATFLEDVSDLTGAYFDQATNRIVFVGKKNTSTPVFNKDDLAVAVKSVIFDNTLPAVNIDAPVNGLAPVTYFGPIQNTNFGLTLAQADTRLKHLVLGVDGGNQTITSSATGYASVFDRYIAKGPTGGWSGGSRYWISPETMSLKLDSTASSFVFDQATMRVQTQALSTNNDPKWNEASNEFVQNLSTYYDQYAQENYSLARTKELGKLVSIVKWLKDNNIATDYSWARSYTPTPISTPSTVAAGARSETVDNVIVNLSGGVDYYLSNTYIADNGTSSALKSTSQSAATSPEANHWEFTQNNQNYVSVAVAASAFRSVGSYNTSVTDMGFDVQGDIDLKFTRAYSSLSGGQSGIGRGWNFIPAHLIDTQPWNTVTSSPQGGYSGTYPVKISFQTLEGDFESFTFSPGIGLYVPDQPYYHSSLIRNTDGAYTVVMKDQTYFKFSGGSMAILMHRDKNNNGVFYDYDIPGSSKITRISDINDHSITITYNTNDQISSIDDWVDRTVSYGYDSQGRLTTVTDPRGNVVHYSYDNDNRLSGVTDRLNQQIFSATYSDQDKMLAGTVAGGLGAQYSYNETDRFMNVTDSNQRVSKVYYDTRGRITKIVDPQSNFIEYTYGTEASPLTSRDKNNNVTTYTYDANGNIASVTYADGKQIAYSYNSKNLVTQSNDSRYGVSPKTTSYTYDSSGNMLTKTEAGVTTTFSYDSEGMLESVMDPLGRPISYQYNNFGAKTTEEDPTAQTTAYGYDSLGRLLSITDANSKSTSFTYDANSNVITTVNAVGTTTNVYDAENRIISTTTPDNKTTAFGYNTASSQTSTTNALNDLTSYGYDQYSNMTSRQDALNHTTQYQYDSLDRNTQVTTPLGEVKKWSYDANGNITKRTDESNRDTIYSYDSMNRLDEITYPDTSVVAYTYDDRGNATQITNAVGITTYAYDQFDRMVSVTDPNNDTVSYTYDNVDNLISVTYPGSKIVNYKYDAANRIKSVTDWNGVKEYYNYDLNGNTQSKLLPNGISAEYTYDNANRLSSLQYSKDQRLITRFDYTRDSRGNVTNETETKPATSSDFTIYEEALASGWSKSWSWDSNVNLGDTSNPYTGTKSIKWQVTAGWGGLHIRKTTGTISTANYNAITFAMKSTQANQEVEITLKNASDEDTSAPVDIARYGNPVSSGYTVYAIPLAVFDAVNTQISGLMMADDTGSAKPNMYIDSIKLTKATPTPITLYEDSLMYEAYHWLWNGTVNFSYTNQPFSGINAINLTGTAGFTGVQFNRDREFSTKGYSFLRFALKGTQVGQDYTIQITDTDGNGIGPEVDISDYAGRVDTSDYTIYSIPLTDLGAQNVMSGGLILQNQNDSAQPSVVFDKVQLVPAVDTTNVATQQSAFTYDSVDRLLSATYPYGSYTYTYDAVGNRLTSNENGVQNTYSYNNDNQLGSKGGRTFTYDDQGNQTSDNTRTLAYDFDSRLISYSDPNGQTVNYVYDGTGNRIRKSITGGASYQYTNDVTGELSQVLVSKNTTTGTSVNYVYGGGLISQGDSSASSRQYYLDDGIGNIRYTTSNTGTNVQAYTYDPYGNIVTGSGSDYSFQEQEKDSENGLTYLRARYYDSTTGRFTARDPVAGTLRDTQTQNGYNYANANPVNRTDPSGELAPLIVWGIWAIFAAWTAYDIYNDTQNCDYAGAAINGIGFLPFGKIAKVGTVVFKLEHGMRHLDEIFDAVAVQNKIRADIYKTGAPLVNQSKLGVVKMNGADIQYRAYGLSDGTTNVGTWYIINK